MKGVSMRITWMPDDQSGMKRYEVENIEEFLSMTGYKIHGTFDGPGMYVVTSGKPSKLDIEEGEFDSPGPIIGSMIVR